VQGSFAVEITKQLSPPSMALIAFVAKRKEEKFVEGQE
jgi:hypothetical protein